MIWYFKKITEDNNVAIYSYTSVKNDIEPGKISYDKITQEIKMVEKAKNDPLSFRWASTHFLSVVKDGFPEIKTVMIG
jgi:hypothetical protein